MIAECFGSKRPSPNHPTGTGPDDNPRAQAVGGMTVERTDKIRRLPNSVEYRYRWGGWWGGRLPKDCVCKQAGGCCEVGAGMNGQPGGRWGDNEEWDRALGA